MGPRRLAARGRDGLPPRADRAREHLPERRDPRHAPRRDHAQVRRDRRVRRGRALHRHAGQALLERDVPAARVRGRRAPRAGDPARRRGARGRRRGVPAEVPREDERRRRRGADGALRQPQHGRDSLAHAAHALARARRARRVRTDERGRLALPRHDRRQRSAAVSSTSPPKSIGADVFKQTARNVSFDSLALLGADGEPTAHVPELTPLRFDIGLQRARADPLPRDRPAGQDAARARASSAATRASATSSSARASTSSRARSRVTRCGPGIYSVELGAIGIDHQDIVPEAMRFEVEAGHHAEENPRYTEGGDGVVRVDSPWSEIEAGRPAPADRARNPPRVG